MSERTSSHRGPLTEDEFNQLPWHENQVLGMIGTFGKQIGEKLGISLIQLVEGLDNKDLSLISASSILGVLDRLKWKELVVQVRSKDGVFYTIRPEDYEFFTELPATSIN